MGNKTLITNKYYGRGNSHSWPSEGSDFRPPVNVSYYVPCGLVRTASDNPKYKSAIANHQSATNYCRIVDNNVHFVKPRLVGEWTESAWRPDLLGKRIETTILSNLALQTHGWQVPSLYLASVDNKALVGIIKKIRKFETSDLAGPTFIGELRETIGMIRSPLKSLRTKTGLFTDLQMRILRDKQAKGKKFKPQSWTQVLSDTWLEYSFGAAPLVSDIAAIAQLYLDLKTKNFDDKSLKRLSYRFTDDYYEEGNDVSAQWPGTGFSVPYKRGFHYRASSQYVVWVDQSLNFPDTAVGNLITAAKFGWDEIIPTAWELMPWSFLIDYFTNIGDVLGSTFDYNRTVAFGKRTTHCTTTEFHIPGVPYSAEPKSYRIVTFEPWSFTGTNKVIERTAISNLQFPQLDVSLPSFGQAVNIAALFSSLSRSNPFKGFSLK